MELAPSQHIKGYELKERIGAGGFGAVYRAQQSTIGREVAIKIILPAHASQPDFIRRFEAEAQIVARLEHPHITPLYDYWRDPDGAYLVMRWLRGGSLRDVLKKGAFDLKAAVTLMDQVAAGLSLAHRNGVIHRDIKPANILLDEDGNAYLTDFGIAKDLILNVSGTQSNMIIGSLDYISPEQARSEAVTARTDIYSLGVTLFEVLAGHHPFADFSSVVQMYKHINEPLPEITTLEPGIGDAVNRVIQKATAKNPDHRYQDALAFAVDFREAVGFSVLRPSVVEQLTQREHEILNLIVEGLSNKDIAARLTVTLSTVKWYVNQIYNKLGVRSRVQAIVRARELDLIVKENAQLDENTVVQTDNFHPVNPYKGLRAFQAADNQDYYGREKIISRLVKRLSDTGDASRFLAVVGPSGSGKSSLVRAGLIPALWRGDVPGSEKWFVVEMMPGSHPLDEIEIALTRLAGNQSGNLNAHLRRDARGLIRTAALILPDDGSELMLVIDQFEEVFTLSEDDEARQHFLALLHAAATDPRSRVRVIITLRADFYDRPLHYPEFGELVHTRMETIMPLSVEELERAITKPAEQVGVTFEAGLVSTIIADVNYQPGALPLLQYALTELFMQRKGRVLTSKAYHDMGGAVAALAKRSEALFIGFDANDRELARQMFLRLVTLGDGVEDTRRRVNRSELLALTPDTDLMDEIIDTYAEYRLLSLDNEPTTRSPTVEVAHEAILKAWDRLKQWLAESRDDIRMQRQLAAMAAEWRGAKQDASFLARGSRLSQLEGWSNETKLALTELERAYLNASVVQQAAEAAAEIERQAREQRLERRSQTFLSVLVVVLTLALLGAFGLTAFAFDRESQAVAARAEALNAQATSEANVVRVEQQLQQRLALSSGAAMDDGAIGNIGVALALRSLAYAYTPQADAALARATGQGLVRHRLTGHEDIDRIMYSHDGRVLAISGKDRTILYDALSGQSLHELPHEGFGGSLVFLPNTPSLIVGSQSGAVVWNTDTGEQIHMLATGKAIYTAELSTNGQTLFTVDVDEVIIWDTNTWQAVQRFPRFTGDIETLVLVDDGVDTSWFVQVDNVTHRMFMVDVVTGEETCELVPAGDDAWVQFKVESSVDTPLLLVSTANPDERRYLIHPFNYHTCTALPVFDKHQTWTGTMDYDPIADVVISRDAEGYTYWWRLLDHRPLSTFKLNQSSVLDIAISPDGSQLAMNQFNIGLVFDLTAAPEPRVLMTTPDQYGYTTHPFFSPDGESLYIGGPGRYSRWNLAEQSSLPMTTYDQFIGLIAVAPDNRTFAAAIETRLAETDDFNVNLIDAVTDDVLRTFTGHSNEITGLDFSPDGRLLAASSFDRTVHVWEVATGEIVRVISEHDERYSLVQFSQDGRLLLSASFEGAVRLWDVASGEQVRVFDQGLPIVGAALSPDGQRVVIGDGGGDVVMWDAISGERILTLGNHGLPVYSVNYSPDGGLVVSAGFDGTARLWDGETGALVRVLDNGTEKSLFWAEFSPDGQTLAVGGDEDDRVYLWQVSLDETIARICQIEFPDLTPEERAQYGIADENPVCPPME